MSQTPYRGSWRDRFLEPAKRGFTQVSTFFWLGRRLEESDIYILQCLSSLDEKNREVTISELSRAINMAYSPLYQKCQILAQLGIDIEIGRNSAFTFKLKKGLIELYNKKDIPKEKGTFVRLTSVGKHWIKNEIIGFKLDENFNKRLVEKLLEHAPHTLKKEPVNNSDRTKKTIALFFFLTLLIGIGNAQLRVEYEREIHLNLSQTSIIPIKYYNDGNEILFVDTTGDPRFFALPISFNIDAKAFNSWDTIVTGSRTGIFARNITVTYTSLNNITNQKVLSLPVTIVVGQIQLPPLGTGSNQTNQTQTNQTILCTQSCYLRPKIITPINSTFLNQRELPFRVLIEGSYSSYSCLKIYDGEEENLGSIINGTETEFTLFEVTGGHHKVGLMCNAGNITETVNVEFTSEILNVQPPPFETPPIDQPPLEQPPEEVPVTLTKEEVEVLVDRILNSDASKSREQLEVLQQLQDFSCLYSETRFNEMYKAWLDSSEITRSCLPYLIEVNASTADFFMNQCPYIQEGDIFTSKFVLNELEVKGFAAKECVDQTYTFSVVKGKGGETELRQRPVQFCYYYPADISQGCITKFEGNEQRKVEFREQGFSEGALVLLSIILFTIFVAIIGARSP